MAAMGLKTVLVVDDELGLREMVTMILEAEGYRVETAADGMEALDRVRQGIPDLILLDMTMPVMDGWTFAREFHAKYDHRVPIVVFTASDNARKRAEEIEADGYVGKPFDLDTLVETVKQYFLGEQAAA